jgi:hypothetical protein
MRGLPRNNLKFKLKVPIFVTENKKNNRIGSRWGTPFRKAKKSVPCYQGDPVACLRADTHRQVIAENRKTKTLFDFDADML